MRVELHALTFPSVLSYLSNFVPYIMFILYLRYCYRGNRCYLTGSSTCFPCQNDWTVHVNYRLASFRGKFALVKKCRNKKTGELFAAKVYGKRAGRRGERAKALNNEISVLGIVPPHPRIVKLLEVYHGQTEVVLILELWVLLMFPYF